MQPAIPYIAFPGTCRDAMTAYASILGGEITTLTTMAEAPIESPLDAADFIFNSEVVAGELRIRASDNPARTPVGSSISIFLRLDDVERHRELHEQLSEGGQVIFPSDGGFSMVSDRFGVQWMLALDV
ncbi:VOC family protein [Euzebya tangerina]|uniref:VOC family protein n=1 Tax=Euzebya tangerina TaxID=591198 RepID=UPI000E322B98|nr:VOC family protein [Euzebya tangerina]